jgi:hypothetical protein
MLVTLVIVAGSAKAAAGDKFNPYPGGTYTYNLPYTLAHNGNVKLTLTGGDMTVGTTTPAGLTAAGAVVTLNSGTGTIAIPITFDGAATGTKKIAVEITDLTSNCSNNIYLNVDMAPKPSLLLALSSSTLSCQKLNASPANNEAASLPTTGEPLLNTITFTVAPTVANIANYSYGYTLTIPTDGQTNLTDYKIAYSGPGTATENAGNIVVTGITGTNNASGTFTLTFTTTTGKANETITGTLSAAILTDVVNAGTYIATLNPNPVSTTVNSVPSIGAFN